ncbi:MAG: phosphoenolpyruvate--protein phosphotransferase, partial [Omnitrophica WOR_2 bacterium]
MKTISGIGISAGIALGELYRYEKQAVSVEFRSGLDPAQEMSRLEKALAKAKEELQAILENASSRMKKEDADIFSAHLMILEDPELLDQVKARLGEQKCNAEWAWNEAINYYSQLIAGLGDEYMAARSADVLDVGQRVLRSLAGQSTASHALVKPVIVVAEELTPSDTVTFDPRRVLAFCTAKGGPTSHIAILSKALGIPAVTGLGPWMGELVTGRFAIIDGEKGCLILEPDETSRKEYENRSQANVAHLRQALQTALAPAVTLDGRQVEVVANIGSVEAATAALEYGAEGVGLLRTEFLFLDRESAPDEEEQADVYRRILETFEQRPVVIRTLDIGGDKPAPYLSMPVDLNPFLGVRGARLGLKHPEVLRTQLRALLSAGIGHNLKIMFPMISTLGEIRAVRGQ